MSKKFCAIIYLSLAGLLAASFLLYQYLFPPVQSICHINYFINCDASTKGQLAITFGIPTALYGLIGYLLILLAALKKWQKLLIGVSSFGLFFCLRITFLEIFVIKQICPVCLVCQLIMITIFILAIWPRKKAEQLP